MTSAFLLFANLWLLARLVCLFRDEAARPRVWQAKTVVELVALTALYPFSGAWLGAAVTVVGLNLAAYRIEQRAGRKDLARLLLGIAGLAAWSVWFSPQLAGDFRPGWQDIFARLQQWTALGALLDDLSRPQSQIVLLGLLLSANETNLLVRAVFDQLDLKPRVKEGGDSGDSVDEGEFNRGRVIGMLERVLLYAFVLQVQYGAIGFVLAAKAFTRSKALENNRAFGEYVLIGTLLSACLALLIGGAVRWLLGSP